MCFREKGLGLSQISRSELAWNSLLSNCHPLGEGHLQLLHRGSTHKLWARPCISECLH